LLLSNSWVYPCLPLYRWCVEISSSWSYWCIYVLNWY
jgi:hypothetical protein